MRGDTGTRFGPWLLAALAALAVAVGVVLGRAPAAVDWRDVRAVALESDDWGLCGFVPSVEALAGFDADAVQPGRFPAVYWHSSLEDSAQVAEICGVLAATAGRDGLPAVLQPNYITASLAWEPVPGGADTSGHWVVRELPDLPPAYSRPGLWQAVAAGRAAGVWHPELHGRWHYDPDARRAAVAASAAARDAAREDLLLFPRSAEAWELGAWRPTGALAAELRGSLDVFGRLFGRPPRSIIAPDYVWDDRCERLWLAHGLAAIQAHRGQRSDAWRGWPGRLRKLAHRTWARLSRPDRVYLVRNCLFEPAQHEDPAAVVADCGREIREAWRRGEPAVVETHRVNFAHLDSAVARAGREALGDLLAGLPDAPGEAPLFLVGGELAGLQRQGTSWRLLDDHLVVRNLTRSRRVLVVPPEATAALAVRRGLAPPSGGRPLVVSLAPGETRLLAP